MTGVDDDDFKSTWVMCARLMTMNYNCLEGDEGDENNQIA